jgi:hypothetical protein
MKSQFAGLKSLIFWSKKSYKRMILKNHWKTFLKICIQQPKSGNMSQMPYLCGPQDLSTRSVFSAESMFDFAKTSDETLDEAPKAQFKVLPNTLRYEFLDPNVTYPVIINSKPDQDQTQNICFELRKHRKPIGEKATIFLWMQAQ